MSIRIIVDDPRDYYTNLDYISGRVFIGLDRPEDIGAIVVKLEGESKTLLAVPDNQPYYDAQGRPIRPGTPLRESHKVLYQVQQIFPTGTIPPYAVPVKFQPGGHEYPFRFRIPFNNACNDPGAMSRIGGLAGSGGYGVGSGLFSLIGGIRVLNGASQMRLQHVTQTLPPSFTGLPRQAEVRYYIKVTIQRPGLLSQNWRHQLGLKFLPIEPPRPLAGPGPAPESFARRPFTFQPRIPRSVNPGKVQKGSSSSLWGGFGNKSTASFQSVGTNRDSKPAAEILAPSIEISARLPDHKILTCNEPIPLRLIAKKMVSAGPTGDCYLTSLEIELLGTTHVRSQALSREWTSSYIVISRSNLLEPLQRSVDDPVGTELVLPDLWKANPLPNTVIPSFHTCNLSRSYQLRITLGVTWGTVAPNGKYDRKMLSDPSAQMIRLPLHFDPVEVYSGLTPDESLIAAMRRRQQQQHDRPPLPTRPSRPDMGYVNGHATGSSSAHTAPHDPLYPPQLRPGQVAGQAQSASYSPSRLSSDYTGYEKPNQANRPPPSPSVSTSSAQHFPAELADNGFSSHNNNHNSHNHVHNGHRPPTATANNDDAPPSYDEAIADNVTNGVAAHSGGNQRPAYSGVTNENAPDTLGTEKE